MSTKINQQAMGLQVFYNEDANVNIRTEVINDEPWFAAKDVAMALDIDWSGKTLASIPEDWKGMGRFPINGSEGGVSVIRKMVLINESAMYKLAFRSNKPGADRFVNWIAGEVLPSIRRTGSYSSNAIQPAIEQKANLPLPRFRPFYAEWKETITPYISKEELESVAQALQVTYAHVRKVYTGTSVSSDVVCKLTAFASMNRNAGISYPPARPVYEQMVIAWGEDCNENH